MLAARPAAAAPFSAIVVAGTHSGVGKTSVTLGLIGALARRGLAVQPFKVGPDFIDPLHHTRAAGRTSRNLDGWMLDREANRACFARAAATADVAVVEGVMGLFDGSEGAGERGSTAEMAKLLDLPVVLVIDAGAMARSAAALIHGFASFDPALRIAGVVLNNVGGDGHAALIREAVADTAIVGAIPRVPDLRMPERHLGLHLPHEAGEDHAARLATLLEAHLDVERLLDLGRVERRVPPPDAPRPAAPSVRIGVARDEAFCFYYAENLELLERAGAELIEFSPIRDPLPPGLDGLYLGGGYPELHAPELAANEGAKRAIRDLADAGAPIYAECGGLMYLAEALELDGSAHPLCGVLPFSTKMPAPLKLAYVEVETTGGPFGAGRSARGHVFHHSEILGEPPLNRHHRLRTTTGEEHEEGYGLANVLASYAHLHFGSEPALASAFVARCKEFQAAAQR